VRFEVTEHLPGDVDGLKTATASAIDVTSLGKYLENGGSQSFASRFVPLLHFRISATACFQEVHKQAMREGGTEKAILLGNYELKKIPK
jgi:hypothetical protein